MTANPGLTPRRKAGAGVSRPSRATVRAARRVRGADGTVAGAAVVAEATEAVEAATVAVEATGAAVEAAVGSGFDGLQGSTEKESLVRVGGRISQFAEQWEKLPLNHFVREVVQLGHSIPFLDVPPTGHGVVETQGDLQRLALLEEEVAGLLVKGAVERVPSQEVGKGWYSTYFLVAKKTGDWRPILNLKPLNRLLQIDSFKMETLRNVILSCHQGEWLASLDLKDAYFHVLVREAHRRFLRFCIRGVHYQYRVLPFGLSTSPRVFTKVLVPVIESLRLEGIHIHPYLDDILLRASSRAQLLWDLRRAVSAFQAVGYVINWRKSELVPARDLVFIGGRFRTDVGGVFLPEDRKVALLRLARSFRVGELKSAHAWLRLLGVMAAAIPVVKYTRLRMRPIQLHFLSRWDAQKQSVWEKFVVPFSLRDHLRWWTVPEHLDCGMPLSHQSHDHVLTTDASMGLWGGWLDVKTNNVSGVWGEPHRSWHINRLELRAVQLVLRHFQEQVRGSTVLVRTDNTTTSAYINRQGGTRSPDLCLQAWDLFHWAIEYGVELRAAYLPGVKNVHADSLSRVGRLDSSRHVGPADQREWSLKKQVTQQVFLLLGEPNIDLFATVHNRQCLVFCSLQSKHGELAVDSLSISWTGMFGYAYPPTKLIPRVLSKVQADRATIILIAPRWATQSWYPTLLRLLTAPPVELPIVEGLLTQPGHTCSIPEFFKLTAWRLSGMPSDSEEFRRTLWISQSRAEGRAPDRVTRGVGACSCNGAENRVTIPLVSL